MVVGAAGNQVEPVVDQSIREGPGVVDDLLGIGFERWMHGLAECDGLRRGNMVVRAALEAGEYGPVDIFTVFLLAHDNSTTRSSKRFVRGGGHHISHWKRRRVHAAYYKA